MRFLNLKEVLASSPGLRGTSYPGSSAPELPPTLKGVVSGAMARRRATSFAVNIGIRDPGFWTAASRAGARIGFYAGRWLVKVAMVKRNISSVAGGVRIPRSALTG
jgi:hypothetical protein